MDLLIFGTGNFYKNRRHLLDREYDNIICFLDNRAKEIGTFEGRAVCFPDAIINLSYDAILLMSTEHKSMKNQLLQLGVNDDKIWDWERYFRKCGHGRFRLYLPEDTVSFVKIKKRVAIITTYLNYNGGSIAILYAAVALKKLGYDVSLVAPDLDEVFLNDILKMGIRVIRAPGMNWMDREELVWLGMYDIVLVNTFQMLRAACLSSKYFPTIWWIHEPDGEHEVLYRSTMEKYAQDAHSIMSSKVEIYAVSNIAKSNFEVYYPCRIDGVLPYGIPDNAMDSQNIVPDDMCGHGRFIFVIIGEVTERKSQLVFIEAALLLPELLRKDIDLWIIGSIGSSKYSQHVEKIAARLPNVKILGTLSRSKMEEALRDIDVVVCPSVEDPMPIVITEGWMHGKVCIMSDATGQADMTEDGVNGLVCKAGDAQDLADKMAWVLQNQDKLDGIRQKGRETYEKYFSMESFGERLEQALLAAERKFNEQKD